MMATANERRSVSQPPKIYTRTGDDGTTGFLYGGRVQKNSPMPEACGAVDEAQAAIGLARALLSTSPTSSFFVDSEFQPSSSASDGLGLDGTASRKSALDGTASRKSALGGSVSGGSALDGTASPRSEPPASLDAKVPSSEPIISQEDAIAATEDAAVATAELESILVNVIRDLWLLMAELAVDPDNRRTTRDNRVTVEMVGLLEEWLDSVAERVTLPTEFVIPGEDLVAAQLDVARTVVRRAERRALDVAANDSQVVPYLNRLSDLLWTLARWREGFSRPVREI